MIARYLSLVKFSHTVFALPFALVGLAFGFRDASVPFAPDKLLYVLLCMVFARSAAMGFNRWADRHFDAANARTATRELPSGQVSPAAALAFVVGNCVLFVATTWFINPLCFALSPVALAVILGYSYTKRFTPLCHLVLGAGLALAPVGAYIAVTERFDPGIVVLGVAVFAWVAGFDIVYALQDEAFDRAQGLQSIPVLLGQRGAIAASQALHVVAALAVAAAGWWLEAGWLYALACAVFWLVLVWQHRLVRPGDLSRIDAAFFTTNGSGSVVFGVLAVADVLLLPHLA